MIYESSAPVGTAIQTLAFVPHPRTGVQLLPSEVDHYDLIVTSKGLPDPLLELHNQDIDDVLSAGVTPWPASVEVSGGSTGSNFDHTIYHLESGFEPRAGTSVCVSYWLWLRHETEPGKFDPVIVQHIRHLKDAPGIGLAQP